MEYTKTTKLICLDVHKNSISSPVTDGGPDGEIRLYGTIKNTIEALNNHAGEWSIAPA